MESLNTPMSVAPMISGLLLIRWTWPSVFWFLSIISPVVLFIMVLFLPETCRRLVGDGTGRISCVYHPVFPVLLPRRDALADPYDERHKASSRLLNPLSTLGLLKRPATLAAILCYGIYYTVHSCLQASLSTIFVNTYHLSGLKAGVIYIPFGAACSIASIVAGTTLWSLRI